jgi:GGDEF domain-containing protein
MKKHNDLPEKEFRISIAHGFAVYNKNSASRKLMDIYQQADMKMYENKKYMKAHQSRPEEYYKDVAVSKSGSELKIS